MSELIMKLQALSTLNLNKTQKLFINSFNHSYEKSNARLNLFNFKSKLFLNSLVKTSLLITKKEDSLKNTIHKIHTKRKSNNAQNLQHSNGYISLNTIMGKL